LSLSLSLSNSLSLSLFLSLSLSLHLLYTSIWRSHQHHPQFEGGVPAKRGPACRPHVGDLRPVGSFLSLLHAPPRGPPQSHALPPGKPCGRGPLPRLPAPPGARRTSSRRSRRIWRRREGHRDAVHGRPPEARRVPGPAYAEEISPTPPCSSTAQRRRTTSAASSGDDA
ncbi:unnamed protein product, partial [Prorocentrum cordatum]